MATKRDLVEAYSFSRRRLVTAFVSGAPGGREVEPTRPGRTIVGGVALSVLLLAGAAIAGVFAPQDPQDWNQRGLVVSKETGAAYVILQPGDHPVLRPVINITSAKLLLGSDAEPTILSQETIEQQEIGDDVGILGAPANLPAPSLLVDDGWTACTARGAGLRVSVAAQPEVRVDDGLGFVVRSGKEVYLVARSGADRDVDPAAYAYRLPDVATRRDSQDTLLAQVGLGNRSGAVEVPPEWLHLFPAGGELSFDSFGLTGLGRSFPDPEERGLPGDARIGDVVTSGGRSLLLTQDGPAPLDDFALAVYRNTPTPDGPLGDGDHGRRKGGQPLEWHLDQPPTGGETTPPYAAAHWPTDVLRPAAGDHCARLTTTPGQPPRAELATDATGDASPADTGSHETSFHVDAGHGAYVLSGAWQDGTTGAPFLVDAKHQAYPLVGADVAGLLGYADVPQVVVPDSWVELFDPGVPLSVDAAGCPPSSGSTSKGTGKGETSCG